MARLSEEEASLLRRGMGLSLAQAEKMIENVVGIHGLKLRPWLLASITHAYADAYRDTDSDTNRYADAHGDANRHTHVHSDINQHPCGNTDWHGHTANLPDLSAHRLEELSMNKYPFAL